MGIGERIKRARQSLGYSAEQVAEHLGVAPTTIYRYENGDISKLPSNHIIPLAEFLHISPQYLMGWESELTSTLQTTEEAKFEAESTPKNKRVRILCRGLNRLSPEDFDKAEDMFRIMFSKTYPDLFEKGNDDK